MAEDGGDVSGGRTSCAEEAFQFDHHVFRHAYLLWTALTGGLAMGEALFLSMFWLSDTRVSQAYSFGSSPFGALVSFFAPMCLLLTPPLLVRLFRLRSSKVLAHPSSVSLASDAVMAQFRSGFRDREVRLWWDEVQDVVIFAHSGRPTGVLIETQGFEWRFRRSPSLDALVGALRARALGRQVPVGLLKGLTANPAFPLVATPLVVALFWFGFRLVVVS